MFRNYLLIALRVLKKNTLFSIINIAGLSIGLAASIIIYLWVQDELDFDGFHENANRIYRVERSMTLEGEHMHVPITSPPLGPRIIADYPAVEAFVRLAWEDIMVEDANRSQFRERLFYADSSFFSVFSFPLIRGDLQTALEEPFTVAISRSYAVKYFGEIPEPGSMINVNYSGDIRPYRVTAVFEDFPHNSHIQAGLIGSFSSLNDLRHEMMMKSWMANNHYTYILLGDGIAPEPFEEAIQDMVDQYFGPEFRTFIEFDDPRDFLRLTLMPLTGIHLNSNRLWEIEPPGSKTSVIVFSLISVLLLFIAGINFMNLSTARASRRALEVGVRKISGASRTQLVIQFLGESALFSLFSLAVAFILIELALPWFSGFTGKEISASAILSGWNLPVISAAWLTTVIFSGIYPAFFLSSYRPVHVLKGKKGPEGSQLFRKALVVGQFAVSIGLIICSISVYRQLQYINSKDLGYDRNGLINIRIENRSNFRSWDAFREDLLAVPGVITATRSMTIPATREYMDNPHRLRGNPETYFPVINRIDEHFIPAFRIRMLAGTNFSAENVSDTTVHYIINDSARKMFGFDSPADALGHQIGIPDGLDGVINEWGQIVGVVEDFHFQPLTELIKPMVMNTSSYGHNHITVKIDQADAGEINFRIGEIWNSHFPGEVYSSTFVSDNFDAVHLTERRLQVILLIFTFMSILIACLGLLGLSSFSVEQRIKEIGIRKALGAQVHQVVALIASEFSRLVALSCLIAIPVAYFVLREWLTNFPYRRDIEVLVFLAAVAIGWITALLTVLLQTYRAGTLNPTETLKYE